MGLSSYDINLRSLLSPLFQDYGQSFIGASQDELEQFERTARDINVPQEAIEELKRFYRVLNGIDPSLDSLLIYQSGSSMIYEFWQSQGQLWVGQRDMDMIIWKEGRFHLGCAGELNYGEDYVFENLLDLLMKGFRDWYPEENEI
ncbi:MAG: hypothetical protein AAFN93_19305 [Bacteroidota bacterium]